MRRKFGLLALVSALCAFACAATFTAAAAGEGVYLPDTDSVMPPVVITEARTAEEYAAVTAVCETDGERPQVVVLYLDNALRIGGTVSLAQAVGDLAGRAIPAFYVSDQSAAQGLGAYAADNDLYDAYVVSADPALVGRTKAVSGYLFGAVDYRGGDASPSDMVKAVNSCGARTAWLDGADKETVEYLQYRFLNVWASGGISAVLSGANGVAADDIREVYAFLRALPKGALLRKPMIIAHRGLEKVMLENTVSGMLAAYEAGADAVECDIQVSKDDRLVVMHDESLQRTTNGTGKIADLTWDEIKDLEVDYPKAAGYKEKVPLLDDFFEAVKGNGKVLVVELKTIDGRSVPLLKSLIERYDIADQVVMITFFAGQIEPARSRLPGISLGNLSYKPTAADAAVLYKDAASKNVTVNPNYGYLDEDTARQLSLRGLSVYPWTYVDGKALGEGYRAGLHGLTTSDARLAGGAVRSVTGSMILYTDLAVKPSVTAVRSDGTVGNLPAEIVSADFAFSENTGGVTAAETGEFRATVRVSFTVGGQTLYAYHAIGVTVTRHNQAEPDQPDAPIDPDTDDPSEGGGAAPPPEAPEGCGAAGEGSLPGFIGAALLCAGLLSVRIRKRAHGK